MLRRIFGSLKHGLNDSEEAVASKNKTLAKMSKNGTLKLLIVLLGICVVGGISYFAYKAANKQIAKISLQADTPTNSIFTTNRHFKTVITGASLNGTGAPSTEAEKNWENDHYDLVIASTHAKELYERNKTRQIKTTLMRYILINSGEEKLGSGGEQEDLDMKNFCTGTGNMPDGYPMPGLTEAQYEDAYLHFTDDTIVDNYAHDPNNPDSGKLSIPAYNSTNPKASRIINDRSYGNFYMLNLSSTCAKAYKAYKAYTYLHDPSVGDPTLQDQGVIYDGLFVDEMIPGALAALMPTSSGGHIKEFSGKLRTEIDNDYLLTQADILSYVKNIVKAKLGHDFIFLPNMAEYREYLNDNKSIIAESTGGVLTEMWSGDAQGNVNGDVTKWEWAYHATVEKGLYFYWEQREANTELEGKYGYSPSNYAGAKGKRYSTATGGIEDETTGIEARHDMVSLTSYLIARDQTNLMQYVQVQNVENAWGIPMSEYWTKANEMNIGLPTTVKYSTWKTGDVDSKNQPVAVYRRDYENAIVLFRTYNGYVDWDLGAQSPSYDLGGSYRVLYPDGTLSPNVYTSISLAVQEGVVLVPDGYDPMTGGGSVTPPSTNAKVTLSEGGTHNVGETFPLKVDLTANSNNVCAATINLSFPKDQVAVESVDLGSVYTQSVDSMVDNNAGTLSYSIGAPNCSSTDSTLLTVNFRAANSGTGDISIPSVEIVGGSDKNNMTRITTDTTDTTVTINGAPISAPTTTLTITNGVTPNASGYYTTAPVIKLTAVPSAGRTVTNITYQWDSLPATTVNGAVVEGITNSNDGTHTLTYYATDDQTHVEVPKTQVFRIDTTPAVKPVIDPYNQHTYKPSLTLKGTKDQDIVKLFINDSDAGVTINGDLWQKTVDLTINPGTDPDTGKPKAMPQTFLISVEDKGGNRSQADPVKITRHMLGDMDGDMTVGTVDLGGIMFNWHNLINYMADFDFNSTCDIYDFGILMANWTEV